MDRTKSLEPERPALVEGLKVRSIAYPVYVPDGNVNVADVSPADVWCRATYRRCRSKGLVGRSTS